MIILLILSLELATDMSDNFYELRLFLKFSGLEY